jgi:hypothetical protein
MHNKVEVIGYKHEPDATYLKIKLDANISNVLNIYGKRIQGELRLDDGRRITAEQRKKLYATFNDIANYTGDVPEYVKEYLKFVFCAESGEEYFSLSDCSVTMAREFINCVIEFVIRNGIPLRNTALERTDDIDRYLYYCLKYWKCCVCGRTGERHHVNAIGMGNNRRTIDDSLHEKMCLCREHHTETHKIGREAFFGKYKVYGVLFNKEAAE